MRKIKIFTYIMFGLLTILLYPRVNAEEINLLTVTEIRKNGEVYNDYEIEYGCTIKIGEADSIGITLKGDNFDNETMYSLTKSVNYKSSDINVSGEELNNGFSINHTFDSNKRVNFNINANNLRIVFDEEYGSCTNISFDFYSQKVKDEMDDFYNSNVKNGVLKVDAVEPDNYSFAAVMKTALKKYETERFSFSAWNKSESDIYVYDSYYGKSIKYPIQFEYVEGNSEIKNKVNNILDSIYDYENDFKGSLSEQGIVFVVEDLENINYVYNHGMNNYNPYDPEPVQYAVEYSSEFKGLIGNSNFEITFTPMMGDSGAFSGSAEGYYTLSYDGVVYGAINIGNKEKWFSLLSVIYVPDDTPNTDEAFISAAQERVREYLHDDNVSFEVAGNILDLEYYDVEQNVLGIDFSSKTTGKYYKFIKGDKEVLYLIVKDSSKMQKPPKTTSIDVDTDVSVETDSAEVPLETTVQVLLFAEDSGEYKNLMKKLNKNDGIVTDIKMFSRALNGYVEKLENGNFKVSIPLKDNKFKNKNIIAVYVKQDGTIEKHPAIKQDGYAVFETDHFSTYSIVEESDEITTSVSEVDFGEEYVGFNDHIQRNFKVVNNADFAVTLTITNPTSSGPFGSLAFEKDYLLEPGEEYEVTVIGNSSSPFATIPGTYNGTYIITAKEVDGERITELNVDAKIVIKQRENTKISYTTHVENIGWQDYVSNGTMAGTSGRSLRLEGIKIKLENQDYDGDIEYRTHIQNIGWEDSFKKNDEMSGTTGLSYRLEAIEIKLTGEMAEHYDIYYRVHAQNYGWLGWARNGERSGTAGYAYRLEGIEIKMVPKGEKFDGYGQAAIFYDKTTGELFPVPDDAKVSYTTHVENIGWQNYVQDGRMAGTSGQSLRLEGIKIKLLNPEYEGNIEYRTHIQNIGWEDSFKKNDEMSGTEGLSYRLEAIEIKLTGEISEHYDVYYRVHAQNIGWMNWAKNGERSGTAGYAYRLEGIEIVLVEKGQTPPERKDIQTNKAFEEKGL